MALLRQYLYELRAKRREWDAPLDRWVSAPEDRGAAPTPPFDQPCYSGFAVQWRRPEPWSPTAAHPREVSTLDG